VLVRGRVAAPGLRLRERISSVGHPSTQRSRRGSILASIAAAVLIGAALLVWSLAGLGYLLERALSDEAPVGPPASELPLPPGWSVVGDSPCMGSHCSSRDVTLDGPAGTSDARCELFRDAFTQAGWTLREPTCRLYAGADRAEIGAVRGGISADFDWPARADSGQSGVAASLGFLSDDDGKAYYATSNRDLIVVATVLTTAAVASAVIGYRLSRIAT